jgi:hypothetical protein
MIKEIILFALAFLSEFASVLTFIVCTARVGCLHSCILADGLFHHERTEVNICQNCEWLPFLLAKVSLFVISQKLILLTIWSYSAI